MSHSTTSGGCAAAPALVGQVDHRAATAQALAQRPAEVDPPAARIGNETPGPDRLDRQPHALDQGLGRGDLGRGHLLEVLALQDLPLGKAERGVELDGRRLGILGHLTLARLFLGTEGVGEAPAQLLLIRPVELDLGQQQLHHPLEQIGLAPEDVERLVEQLALVAAVDEHRMQRPVEVAAPAEADRLQRAQAIEHLARPDRQPRRPERTGEMHDVDREPPRLEPLALRRSPLTAPPTHRLSGSGQTASAQQVDHRPSRQAGIPHSDCRTALYASSRKMSPSSPKSSS